MPSPRPVARRGINILPDLQAMPPRLASDYAPSPRLPRVVVCGLLALAGLKAAHAQGREAKPLVASVWTRDDAVRQSFVDALEGHVWPSLDRSQVMLHVKTFEKRLQKMYRALPKNSERLLAHATAHYALHRLFAGEDGVRMKGLEHFGGNWSSWSTAHSPARVLQDRLPTAVHSHLEARLLEDGYALHDLAVVAAAVHELAEADARLNCRGVLEALKHSMTDMLPETEGLQAVETCAANFFGIDAEDTDEAGRGQPGRATPEFLKKQHEALTSATTFPWTQIVRTARQVFKYRLEDLAKSQLTASAIVEIAAAVEKSFARQHAQRCMKLKTKLLHHEWRGTGRVRLPDFYAAANRSRSRGHNDFGESVEYLRSVGALDESYEDGVPRVVVPNYMGSPSHCVPTMGLYTLCCVDECEALVGGLESKLKKPYADDDDIFDALQTLRSSSGKAHDPRQGHLRSRLEKIGAPNAGRVRIHGKLFSKFMHHAFPRECVWPRTNTSFPRTAEEWLRHTSTSASANEALGKHGGKVGHGRKHGRHKGDAMDYEHETNDEEAEGDKDIGLVETLRWSVESRTSDGKANPKKEYNDDYEQQDMLVAVDFFEGNGETNEGWVLVRGLIVVLGLVGLSVIFVKAFIGNGVAGPTSSHTSSTFGGVRRRHPKQEE